MVTYPLAADLKLPINVFFKSNNYLYLTTENVRAGKETAK